MLFCIDFAAVPNDFTNASQFSVVDVGSHGVCNSTLQLFAYPSQQPLERFLTNREHLSTEEQHTFHCLRKASTDQEPQ